MKTLLQGAVAQGHEKQHPLTEPVFFCSILLWPLQRVYSCIHIRTTSARVVINFCTSRLETEWRLFVAIYNMWLRRQELKARRSPPCWFGLSRCLSRLDLRNWSILDATRKIHKEDYSSFRIHSAYVPLRLVTECFWKAFLAYSQTSVHAFVAQTLIARIQKQVAVLWPERSAKKLEKAHFNLLSAALLSLCVFLQKWKDIELA